MSKLRYILIFVIVLLITIFTRWLLTSVEEPAQPDTAAVLHHPDYFISNFNATLYDAKGKPNYKLIASHLEHFPDDDSMHIQTLQMEYIDTGNQKWLTTAKHGVAYKEIEVLHLRDDVKVIRDSTNQNNVITLYTNTLKMDSVKRVASTEDEVKIVGKNSTIVATGMLIELDAGKVTLNAKARAEYAP